MNHKVLIVDDEAANLRVLARLLSDRFEVLTASGGAAGLGMLEAHDVALIISDQRMPGMTGIEFLKKAAEMRACTVRIILTGYTDVEALVDSINSGVLYRYITKPWSNTDLSQTVESAVEYYETRRKRHRLEQENKRMEYRLDATIQGCVTLALEMLDLKWPGISAHALRTAEYATAIGTALGLPDSELKQLSLAATLHEVAHVHLPAHLMSRTTMLRDGEFKILQESFRQGVRLLTCVPDLEEVAAIIEFQHDHYDGNGSINRILGEQIPLHARIIAIVDAYDEMLEPSSRSKRLTPDSALGILKSAAGRKFDPALVAVFCRIQAEETPRTSPCMVPVATFA
jgi:adenylate cyclase